MAVKEAIPIYVKGSKHLRKPLETFSAGSGAISFSHSPSSTPWPVRMMDAEHF